MLVDFPALVTAYLAAKQACPSIVMMRSVCRQWVGTLQAVPTRKEVLARQQALCAGHCAKGAAKANKELGLLRAILHWGLDQECWEGSDPTLRIKKWKTPKRKTIGKVAQLAALMAEFNQPALTESAIRDRALFGLLLFTGCRPSEARCALLEKLTPYGLMGCWQKGKTKTGEVQEIPLPVQYMPWLQAWLRVRPLHDNPYLFPGEVYGHPPSYHVLDYHWRALCRRVDIQGLWLYDLRRTLSCTLGNELEFDDHTIRAILNHAEGSALEHYYFKSFDSLTKPIQQYADWLGGLKG